MLIIPSKLPGADFVINPYIGCGFGCQYCYAKFMAKFVAGKHNLTTNTNWLKDNWGKWVIPKKDAVNNFNSELREKYTKLTGKTILMSSTTDPYQPAEAKYKLTRAILRTWQRIQPPAHLEILTRSTLILRDINILELIPHLTVGISISILPAKIFRKLEPKAPEVNTRIQVLLKLKQAGINIYAFIAPVWPGEIAQLKNIVEKLHKLKIPIRYVELLNKISHRTFKTFFSESEIKAIQNMKNVGLIITH